jgi:predicted phage gp36 major capsid-like protein
MSTKQLDAAKALLAVYRDPDAQSGMTGDQAMAMRAMAQQILIRLAEAETLPTSAEAQELLIDVSDSDDQRWRYIILRAVAGSQEHRQIIAERGDAKIKQVYEHHQARYDFGG